MEFTKQQREYVELYAETVRAYGSLVGARLNNVERELSPSEKDFLRVFGVYKYMVPEKIRKSFSQNSDMEILERVVKKLKTKKKTPESLQAIAI